jgi:hypothetical protein
MKMIADEPLIFMTFFNLLTNNNQTIFGGLKADERYPMKFVPYSTNRLIQENIINKKMRLDIIIKHQRLLYNESLDKLNQAWNQSSDNNVSNFAGLTSPELPLWWFEDVNFLGQGSDISFDRDNPNTLEISYPFIFKRCVKVNREFKGGMTNGVRTTLTGGGGENGNLKEFGLFKETALMKDEDTDFLQNQSNQEWYRNYLKNRRT